MEDLYYSTAADTVNTASASSSSGGESLSRSDVRSYSSSGKTLLTSMDGLPMDYVGRSWWPFSYFLGVRPGPHNGWRTIKGYT